jgi:two-component system chemotaxis response regulator CheY
MDCLVYCAAGQNVAFIKTLFAPIHQSMETPMPRILVVDDAKTMRDSLKELLTSDGFDVVEAENGEQGLELLGQCTIDLIISDLNMPGMDGITMCSHIKQLGHNVPIFMLTTQTSPELKVKAKEYGVLAWMVKPHNSDVLLRGIRKVLKL